MGRYIYIKPNRGNRGKKLLIAVVVFLFGVGLAWLFVPSRHKDKVAVTSPLEQLHVPVSPKSVPAIEGVVSTEVSLSRGETLAHLLRRSGVSGFSVSEMVPLIARYLDPKKLKVGQKFRFLSDQRTNKLRTLVIPLDEIRFIKVTRGKNGWVVSVDSKKVTVKRIAFACLIRYSFHRSMRNCGADPDLTNTVEAFLARRMDLFRDVRRGDVIRLIIEKVLVSGRFLRYDKILALRYDGRVTKLTGFYFDNDYYDADGKQYNRPFLPSPLRYSLVKWGKAALNEEKKKNRLSMEYSVPVHTSVFAVGDGEVIFAGRNIRLGRMVVLKHIDNIRTYYARLASIEKGVRAGTHVKQGDRIGKVGRHPLYFAVSKNGVYRKPSLLKGFQAGSLPEVRMQAFKALQQGYIKQLMELPVRNSYGP